MRIFVKKCVFLSVIFCGFSIIYSANGTTPAKKFIVTAYSAKGKVDCSVFKYQDAMKIDAAIKAILMNAGRYRNMVGGQVEYPSLKILPVGEQKAVSYTIYNITLNEHGHNYVKMTYNNNYAYGLDSDVQPIYEAIHWGRSSNCKKRT